MCFAQENLTELYYSGNYSRLIYTTSASISSGDTAFNNFYLKALSEAQLGQTTEAIRTLETALNFYSEDPGINRMLAGQYYEAGDFLKARAGYSAMVKADSSDASSWLKLAEIASFNQDYGAAVSALNRVLVIDTLNLTSLMMMGDILNRYNNSEAVIYYERANAHYPDNQKAAYALGNWYIQAQRADEAIPVCEHVLEIDSTNIRFHKLMGYAYYKMGDPFPAVAHFKNAVGYGDSTLFTFKFMGISHYLSVNFPGAIESLNLALKKDTMDAEVHFFLGASLAYTKAKPEAIFHLNRSHELMKPDPVVLSRIYSELGNIMRLLEEYEEAYTYYNQAWEADTTKPISLYFMASILDNSLHQSEEALVDYQRFIYQLDQMPESNNRNPEVPTIRAIVEDRIIALKEELFFLDN